MTAKHLFDATAILNILRKGRADLLAQGYTLDLALYESLNAVWKERVLLKRISREDALNLAQMISKTFTVIPAEKIRGHEKNVLELAASEETTIYDASYLHTAIRHRSTLITDDKKLRQTASKHVKAITTREYLNQATAT